MGRYWISLSHSSSTHCRTLNSQRYIFEVLEPVVLPYLHGLATAIFQQDNARPHVARIIQRFFVNHQIELLPWPARSPDLSPIKNMWSMVAQRFTQITHPAATPDQLSQRAEAAWSAAKQEHIQSLFESMPRRVAAAISNNGGYSGYCFWQKPHFTEVL
ncbi:transposable element Tcb1 transposase [Trichonephila clavipes]|nr:transposable element Tcb1 transposase [Trichonephila clavipes]